MMPLDTTTMSLSASLIVDRDGNAARFAPDGSVHVRIDPGTDLTDPRYHSFCATLSQSGDTVVAELAVEASMALQGARVQVRDAKCGDTIDLCFYLADDTKVAAFGPVNAPQPLALDGAGSPSGWGAPLELPATQTTSKAIPAGIAKIKAIYNALDADPRSVLVDLIMQE